MSESSLDSMSFQLEVQQGIISMPSARLYFQLMKQLETSPEYKEFLNILQSMGTMLSITLVMNGLVPG